MKKVKKIAALCIAGILLCACRDNVEPSPEYIVEETLSLEMETEADTSQLETEEPVPLESQKPELTSVVPEELKNVLTESFLAGTAAKTLQSMVSDEVVQKEDWNSYLGLGIDETLQSLEDWGGTLLRVDADNDGIEDLFAWIRDGGSSGNTSLQLAKGKEDGSFEVTEYLGTMSQELAFVEFEGQNYLLETDFDYNRKAANGFIVTCFEQGKVSDKVYLEAVASVWEPQIITVQPGYEALAEFYAEHGKDGFHEDSLYDYREDAGSGERVEIMEDKVYYADINNDGVEEWYEKHIFYPSSIGVCVSLENDLYFADAPDNPEYLTSYYDMQYKGTPLMFWVEQVMADDSGKAKQVVCLLTYEGLSTNYIYSYLIEGEDVTEVFEIEYEGQLEWRN